MTYRRSHMPEPDRREALKWMLVGGAAAAAATLGGLVGLKHLGETEDSGSVKDFRMPEEKDYRVFAERPLSLALMAFQSNQASLADVILRSDQEFRLHTLPGGMDVDKANGVKMFINGLAEKSVGKMIEMEKSTGHPVSRSDKARIITEVVNEQFGRPDPAAEEQSRPLYTAWPSMSLDPSERTLWPKERLIATQAVVDVLRRGGVTDLPYAVPIPGHEAVGFQGGAGPMVLGYGDPGTSEKLDDYVSRVGTTPELVKSFNDPMAPGAISAELLNCANDLAGIYDYWKAIDVLELASKVGSDLPVAHRARAYIYMVSPVRPGEDEKTKLLSAHEAISKAKDMGDSGKEFHLLRGMIAYRLAKLSGDDAERDAYRLESAESLKAGLDFVGSGSANWGSLGLKWDPKLAGVVSAASYAMLYASSNNVSHLNNSVAVLDKSIIESTAAGLDTTEVMVMRGDMYSLLGGVTDPAATVRGAAARTKAVEDYTKLIDSTDPGDEILASRLLRRARVHRKGFDIPQATADCDRALAIAEAKHDVDAIGTARMEKALIHYANGNPVEAKNELEAGIRYMGFDRGKAFEEIVAEAWAGAEASERISGRLLLYLDIGADPVKKDAFQEILDKPIVPRI
ncbi:MAG: hypothetical protein ABIH11_08360 [Candidatus Altiarchaeota archaeon]